MPTEYEPLTTINRKHNSNSLKNGNTPPVEYATMRDSAIDVKLTHLKKKNLLHQVIITFKLFTDQFHPFSSLGPHGEMMDSLASPKMKTFLICIVW